MSNPVIRLKAVSIHLNFSLLILGLSIFSFPASATAAEWDDLSSEQQSVLSSYKDQWGKYSADERTRFAAGAKRCA